MNIYITGLGCISAIGNTVAQNRESLRSQKHGLQHAKYLDSRYAHEKYFGEIPYSNEDLLKKLSITPHTELTRTDILAHIAFAEAISQAQLSEQEISDTKTAFISASTVGGMCHTQELYNDANCIGSPSPYIDSYNCSSHTLHIAQQYAMRGITNTINTACSSSANAILYGMRLLQTKRATRVIAGGVDSLAKFTVNGFNSLQIISNEPCKPFDQQRNGLNLGEAAAYIVMETETTCKTKPRLAVLSGAGNASDAFHSSALSEEATGVVQCTEQALQQAGLLPHQIDYINTHGTATDNNDGVEYKGFLQLFTNIPPFSSTKSYTGHTLGAAGALEAVYSVLAIMNQELYPTLHTTNPMHSSLLQKYTTQQITHVLSNSYGFSGNCTSLLFSKA
ncbi:MAG TPA: beta-ketoacyl-[acyl-carrier-protein] synthase family protein [Bacteroidales bacterium]|nr:beta-ketoacyl-[acyl-carrier-protein] synthase family protein [Bacteroidales bacterium]